MMDRKWLWKKKSSEKNSIGETESSSSVSSHSERCSDEPEVRKDSPSHDFQSPEVTSRPASSHSSGDDVNNIVKNLTERLSAALVNVSAKEDLVKQHSKVAKEAVAGWEKAENEVESLKLQLEAAVKKNSILEDRISHLDGALKECVRQLRQSREEQEKNINDAVMKKTHAWEATEMKLESQITDLQKKVESNTSAVSGFVDPHIQGKLQALEKENSALKHELLSQAEELEISTIERDLSNQAAEIASKQHLESIKKVIKLEAECQRLKAAASKVHLVNDHKSSAASSMYVDSCIDSQSDSGERLSLTDIDPQKMNHSDPNKRDMVVSDSWALALVAELDQFKNVKAGNKDFPATSVDIDFMDDFLEMERLAALPQRENETSCQASEAIVNVSNDNEIALRDELEAMSHWTIELEYKIETLEEERAELVAMRQHTTGLEYKIENLEEERAEILVMRQRTTELEYNLEKLEREKAELEARSQQTADLEGKIENLEVEKAELINMSYQAAELEEKIEKLEDEKDKLEREKAELEAASQQIADLKDKIEMLEVEKAELLNMSYRAAELEEKLEKLEEEKEQLESKTDHAAELENKLEKLENEKKKLEVENAQLESMTDHAAELENKLEKLEAEKVRLEEEKGELETAMAKTRECYVASEFQLKEAEMMLDELQKELEITRESKLGIESQLISIEAEARTVSAKVKSLEAAVQRERALSAKFSVRCHDLEEELSQMNEEAEFQRVACSNSEPKIKQEDIVVAAGKLAECQKTIASLGNQLKSLATLEDFLIDTANMPEFSAPASRVPRSDEPWKMHSSGTFSPKRDSMSKQAAESSGLATTSMNDNNSPPSASSSSSSSTVILSHVSSEKNRHGFAKFFSRTKSGIRLEI